MLQWPAMSRIFEATIDADGNIRLLEPVQLPSERRALVTILEEEPAGQNGEASQPRNGEELVAYWKKEGLIGTRPDISASQKHTRRIRRQAERRG